MTIKKAVDHFVFKFNTVWKVTEHDIKALETIMEFVEDKHKKQFNDYQLFAKLYVMVYAQFLERYNTTVFDEIPQKELHRYLEQPLERIIQRFTDKLNDSELYSLFKEIGVDMKHPALVSQAQSDKDTSKIQKAIESKDNFERFTGQVWDYETVKQSLVSQINNVINTIK